MRIYRIDTHEFITDDEENMINQAPLIYRDIKLYGVGEIAKNTIVAIPLFDIDFDFPKLKKYIIIDFHYRSFTISQIISERNKILSEIRNNQR